LVIESDVQKLNPGSIVELFELDATAIGGDIVRWHSGVNELGNDVVWDGDTYSRFPVQATGFERNTQGTLPRPTIRAANVSGLIGAFARGLNDLMGAKIVRRRTFVKYLDAVNFAAGNPQADPNCKFPDEVWFVDRKSAENGIFIEFELSAAFDVQGVKLPRRQCVQNVCPWIYRSAECGYAGEAMFDKFDNPVTDSAQDVCGKRLSSCKARFGQTAPLNFGGFPAVGLIR
jgi:lambda family phage minor tail protein L